MARSARIFFVVGGPVCLRQQLALPQRRPWDLVEAEVRPNTVMRIEAGTVVRIEAALALHWTHHYLMEVF